MPDVRPVVADAGPLIILSAIGQMDLVGELYGQVLVPEAVFSEVTGAGADRPGSAELAAARWAVRTQVEPPPDLLLGKDLGLGESEAITLAFRRNARLLLLDDRRARQVAELAYGLRVKGAPGILVEAKKRGLIKSIRPLLEQMRAKGYFLAQAVIDRALYEAGEMDSS
jgi:predicted nucleic acid-binding protein